MPKLPTKQTSVVHATNGDKHAVFVNDLRVMLIKDGDSWFAQGLDIDYASAGSSVDEAKKNFEIGFAKTIREYLAMYGDLAKFMQGAPEEAWQEFLNAPPETLMTFASYHMCDLVKETDDVKASEGVKLPFGNIVFIQQQAA